VAGLALAAPAGAEPVVSKCAKSEIARECGMPGHDRAVCDAVTAAYDVAGGSEAEAGVDRLIRLSSRPGGSAPGNADLINTRLIACGLDRRGATEMAATVLADEIAIAHRTLPAQTEPAGALPFLADLIVTQIDLGFADEAGHGLVLFDQLAGGLEPLYSVVLAQIQLGGDLWARGRTGPATRQFDTAARLAPLIPNDEGYAVPPGWQMLLALAQTQIDAGAAGPARQTLARLDRLVATLPEGEDQEILTRAIEHQRRRL